MQLSQQNLSAIATIAWLGCSVLLCFDAKGADGIFSGANAPNETFADLLSTPLCCTKVGSQTVRFGDPIMIDVIVDDPVGNSKRGNWGRGRARAIRIGDEVVDENQVRVFVLGNPFSKDTLTRGNRYRLSGVIRNGFAESGQAAITFQLNQPPVSIAKDDSPSIGEHVIAKGVAINQSGHPYIKTDSTTTRLLGMPEWPSEIINASVSISGQKKTDGLQVIATSFPNLNELKGHQVELQGTMWSLNGVYWFEHAKQNVIVSQWRQRPGAEFVGHGVAVTVRGKLEKELRPSLDQISLKTCRDLVPTFTLKQSTIKPKSKGASAFFFREVPNTSPVFRDGVLDLSSERFGAYNIMPWMNSASSSYRRNADAIKLIIERDSPPTREVVRSRMNDGQRDFVLRLFDAGILAAVNDDAGREFLLKQARDKEQKHLDSVYWVIGNLHSFPPVAQPEEKRQEVLDEKMPEKPNGAIVTSSIFGRLFDPPRSRRPLGNVDMAWSKDLLVEAVQDKTVVKNIGLIGVDSTRRDVAIQHGGFADLIARLNFESGISALAKIAMEPGFAENHLASQVLSPLLQCDLPVVQQTARSLIDATTMEDRIHRSLIGYFFSRNQELVVEKLVDSIDEHFAFQGLLLLAKNDRDLVLKHLRARVDKMDSKTRATARILEVLLQKENRNQSLIDTLNEDPTVSRNHILYWLAKDPTPEIASEVAEILYDCPASFFSETEFINTKAVEHAINACTVPNSDESIRSLIMLLDADFDRFDIYTEPGEWPKYVAEKLIELTDVSFGTDKAKWKQWYRNRSQKN